MAHSLFKWVSGCIKMVFFFHWYVFLLVKLKAINSFKRLSILFTHQCMALCQCVLVCLFSFPIIGVYSYLCSLREGVTTFASGASVKVLLDSFFSVTNVLLPVSYIFRIKKFVNIQFKKSSQIKIYHLVILYPLWA